MVANAKEEIKQDDPKESDRAGGGWSQRELLEALEWEHVASMRTELLQCSTTASAGSSVYTIGVRKSSILAEE